MSENKKAGNVSDALNAAANLAKEIPVYEDAVQPVAKQTGKALETVGRCVNAALAPVAGVVWGVEKIQDWIETKVTQKLENVEPEKIVSPDLAIAGPTVEALKFTGHKEELSDMFAELLSTAMNSDTLSVAHPGYVTLVSAMSSFDARVLKEVSIRSTVAVGKLRRQNDKGEGTDIRVHFAPDLYEACSVRSSDDADRFHASIDNLARLGLLEATYETFLVREGAYDHIEKHSEVERLEKELAEFSDQKIAVVQGIIKLTMFGRNFAKACLPKGESNI